MIAVLSPISANARSFFVDVNCDGEVNIGDVTAIIDFILSGESASPIDMNKSYLSAREFGAVGDGQTDDTDALEELFDAAFMLKKAVFFDPGTYLIRRSLLLRSGMEIYGEDATIKKPTAVTTTLTEPVAKGQTYLDVASSDGFNVGDQFFIADPNGANWCTYGIITAIDGNRISFTNIISDQQSAFPGCIKAYDRGLSVSTSFALLRSWAARFACDGVSIHDLTLDGNRTPSEPKSWANSCLHLDSYYAGGYTGQTGIMYRNVQRNLVASNLTIKNSPHDGISDQSEGGLIVKNCVIENSAMHGVHVGTRFAGGLVMGNRMQGNGSVGAGVFFCQTVTDVIVENNEITAFNHGCSDEEFGTAGKYITIRNNQFKNITNAVFDFLKATSNSHGGGLLISDNKIQGLNTTIFSGTYLDNVIISNNVVSSVAASPSTLIRATNSRNVILSGNTVPSTLNVNQPVTATNTVNLIDDANSWDD